MSGMRVKLGALGALGALGKVRLAVLLSPYAVRVYDKGRKKVEGFSKRERPFV